MTQPVSDAAALAPASGRASYNAQAAAWLLSGTRWPVALREAQLLGETGEPDAEPEWPLVLQALGRDPESLGGTSAERAVLAFACALASALPRDLASSLAELDPSQTLRLHTALAWAIHGPDGGAPYLEQLAGAEPSKTSGTRADLLQA